MEDRDARTARMLRERRKEHGLTQLERKVSKPILPTEWQDSFGMGVDEHAASTKIDLTEGFVAPEMNEQTDETADTEVTV